MRRALALLCLVTACSKTPDPPVDAGTPWAPGTTYPTPREKNARGFLDRRGLIHSHSYYSHDACDGQPRDDAGVYDQPCYEDFRAGLCGSKHDFAFLSDHQESFTENDFPDLTLYRADHGDALIDHGNGPTANRLHCPDGPAPIVLAGNESDMMPLGLERHAEGKGATYDDVSDAGIAKIHAVNGLAIMAHTERFTGETLASIGLDGFEMYNLHANTLKNGGIAADWVLKADAKLFDGLPDPNIFIIGFELEDPRYLEAWGGALARGARRVTTMGTDCHRNSFPSLAQDGQRIDSYLRMMSLFSNHLLVKPKADGSIDDRDLKEALGAGRLYGSFDFMGYPVGFDFHAESTIDGLKEMGSEVTAPATLHATMPTIQGLQGTDAPTLSLHVYRAKLTGWDEVATSTEPTLTYKPDQPGAYRVEVRIVPKHLRPWVNKRNDLLKAERPWLYSNAIYVK